MRKLLLSAAVAVFGLMTINAQTEKGNWVLGGNTSISFTSTNATTEFDGEEVGDDQELSVFSITPSVGYFVMDNLSVGLDLTFSSTKVDDVTTSSTAIIPNASYFFDAGEKFKPFVGLGAGLVATSAGDDDINKSSGLAIRGTGGIAYFINESVSINFIVQYLNTNQKNKENSDLVTKNSNIGAGIGFFIYL